MEVNGYNLSRTFFDYCFEHPEKVSPTHIAVYFFAIEHCNRLGWKEKFGMPTTMTMESIGLKSYKTYRKVLDELIEWGFIKMIQESKNQYSSNIVALVKNTKATTKALTKAVLKHTPKHCQSIVSIDKPINLLTLEPKNIGGRFAPPTQPEIFNQMTQKLDEFTAMAEASKFFDYYSANGWRVGKNPMKDWKSAVRNWVRNMNTFKKPEHDKQGTSEARTARARAW